MYTNIQSFNKLRILFTECGLKMKLNVFLVVKENKVKQKEIPKQKLSELKLIAIG